MALAHRLAVELSDQTGCVPRFKQSSQMQLEKRSLNHRITAKRFSATAISARRWRFMQFLQWRASRARVSPWTRFAAVFQSPSRRECPARSGNSTSARYPASEARRGPLPSPTPRLGISRDCSRGTSNIWQYRHMAIGPNCHGFLRRSEGTRKGPLIPCRSAHSSIASIKRSCTFTLGPRASA